MARWILVPLFRLLYELKISPDRVSTRRGVLSSFPLIVRVIFVLVLTASAYALQPYQSRPISAAGGLLLGACIIFFEIRLEKVSLKRLIGAAFGSVLGIFGAFLMSLVIARTPAPAFLQISLLLLMTYIGLIVGAKKGDMLNLAALGGIFGGEKSSKKTFKILDTSVIIDGRIADIAETGFLDGVLVIPQFVLRELQLVADSASSISAIAGGAAWIFWRGCRRWPI